MATSNALPNDQVEEDAGELKFPKGNSLSSYIIKCTTGQPANLVKVNTYTCINSIPVSSHQMLFSESNVSII